MKTDKTVEEFERAIADYTGAPYAVAVSSNTNGIFLCLETLGFFGELPAEIKIPKRTYYSVAMSIKNVGCDVCFDDYEWSGEYALIPTAVYDSATRLKRGMYKRGTIRVLSTQYRKNLPIGRGGVILTDNEEYANHLRLIRINGNDKIKGWNMYMTPEQAARGLSLMEALDDDNPDTGCSDDYPDISEWEVWK